MIAHLKIERPDYHTYKHELTFTTKAEYLAFRSEWKTAYKELSQLIRNVKHRPQIIYSYSSSKADLIYDRVNKAWAIATPEDKARVQKIHTDLHEFLKAHNLPWAPNEAATLLLTIRKESKIKSNLQYLAAKAAGAAGGS